MTNLFTTLALSTSLLACTDDVKQPDVLALPGSAYYPESLHADAHGTLYVGSLTTGQVVAFDNGKLDPRTVLAAGAAGVTGETGVLIHGDELWVCSIDTTFQKPTEIRSFGLDGTPHATYTLAADQFCNDLAFDGDTLYATDSFAGNVLRVADGAVESFVQDPRFVPASQGAFGLDGIVVTKDALIVNKLDTGNLFRIDLATKAITEIAVTPPLAGPDGMRALDDHTLLVIEGQAGRLSKISITGDTATATPLATDLDQPTGVVVARGSAWVTEGQIGRLFAQPPQAPNLPFAVRRVDL